jgi:hypothetical protein
MPRAHSQRQDEASLRKLNNPEASPDAGKLNRISGARTRRIRRERFGGGGGGKEEDTRSLDGVANRARAATWPCKFGLRDPVPTSDLGTRLSEVPDFRPRAERPVEIPAAGTPRDFEAPLPARIQGNRENKKFRATRDLLLLINFNGSWGMKFLYGQPPTTTAGQHEF